MKDDKPNATNCYLTEQLNQFGLAYLHMVEPRIAGNEDVEVEDSSFDLNHFRKLFKGTFIAAGDTQQRGIRTILTRPSAAYPISCCGVCAVHCVMHNGLTAVCLEGQAVFRQYDCLFASRHSAKS